MVVPTLVQKTLDHLHPLIIRTPIVHHPLEDLSPVRKLKSIWRDNLGRVRLGGVGPYPPSTRKSGVLKEVCEHLFGDIWFLRLSDAQLLR